MKQETSIPKTEIRYSGLNRAELALFIQSKEYLNSPVLPITPWRARSYINHPRAEAEDKLLFLAWRNDKLVAYLGIFPDRYYLGGKSWKLGWLSCMWVDPICRGQGVARTFLEMAFNSWTNIAVTEFTPAAESLYNKTGKFGQLHNSNGLRAYLRADASEIIPRKQPAMNILKPVIKAADSGFNLVRKSSLKKWSSLPENIVVEYPEKLDEVLKIHIDSWNKSHPYEPEQRNADDISWMLSFPWIKQGPPDAVSERYHFTAYADQYSQKLMAVRNDGKLIGLCMLTIRDGLLKIPCAWINAGQEQIVLHALYAEMINSNTHTLLAFQPEICQAIQNNDHPFFHIRHAVRKYILSRDLLHTLRTEINSNSLLTLQDGHADAGMT